MDSAAAPGPDAEGGEWQLRHDDDGFTYKILKRQRLDEIAAPEPTAVDPEAEERRRRSRKQKVLLKLKRRFQEEIEWWERLSNNFREVEERVRQQTKEQQSVGLNSRSPAAAAVVEDVEDPCFSLVDELLAKELKHNSLLTAFDSTEKSQAEAEERLIRSFSNLCDEAEAACEARRERFAQPFLELPVWSSPRELMASLSDQQ